MSARKSYVGVVAVVAAIGCTFTGSVGARTLIYPLSVTLTGFSPTHGVQGDSITITGTYLDTTKSVEFGSVNADSFTVDPAGNWVKAVIPAGLSNGPLQITLSVLGINQSIGPFYIGPAGPPPPSAQPSSKPVSKGSVGAYIAVAPRISTFSPGTGKVGTKVTINGANFRGVTWLKFGGVNARFTVRSANWIVATVPQHAHSGKITIHTKTGTAVSSLAFKV